ncbi:MULTISPECIES: sigma-70 family RNA polymerase sigma factor [unclassified Knoellia]|uniref:sigma-70 family RNA polymerase sigma factor n=1 Tax=Knoellia altitudinis TaxID=3404795 RepID=UPI003619CA7C
MAPLRTTTPLHSTPPDCQPGIETLLEAALSTTDDRRAARLRKEATVLSLDLADGLARRYRGRGVEVEDLVQVARMALVKATLGYRPGLGHGFAPYATTTITGELKRYFRDHGWAVRPPRRLQELRAEVAAKEELLQQDLRHAPTITEVAEAMDLERDQVREAVACSAGYRAESLNALTPWGTSLADHLACERDDFATLETSAALGSLIAQLDERDRRILTLRFVDEMTQADIGERLGVSQMQISRLLSAILQRLREGLVEDRASA